MQAAPNFVLLIKTEIMKRLFFIIVLLLGFMAVNAQVRRVTLQNVYVTNAAWVGAGGGEVLKQIELVMPE